MNKLTIIFFTYILINTSCKLKSQELDTIQIKNAYQIYCTNSNVICIMVYDDWQEDSYLKLYDINLKLIAERKFPELPLPRIKSVNNNRIILLYNYNHNDSANHYSRLKWFNDLLPNISELKFEHILKYDPKGNSIRELLYFDNFKINKNDFSIIFYNKGKEAKKLLISELYFNKSKIEFVEIYDLIEFYHELKPTDNNLSDRILCFHCFH